MSGVKIETFLGAYHYIYIRYGFLTIDKFDNRDVFVRGTMIKLTHTTAVALRDLFAGYVQMLEDAQPGLALNKEGKNSNG